jgi:hypothetical protein
MVDPVLNIEAALTDPQRWNRYSYAVNRPLTMIDPDGREAGYIYLPNGQMVAPIKGITPTMGKLWAGTIAAGAVVAAGPTVWRAAVSCFLSPTCQTNTINIAEGLIPGPASSLRLPFRSGDIIEREFETGVGAVSMLAEAVVSGKSLHLKDIAVYAKDATVLKVGTKGMLQLLQNLKDEARRLGFEQLRITGLRLSGAKPGKEVDLVFDLTEIK